MSIASRITQMEQHIGNAYDKIEDLGIDITDIDKNIDNISSMLEEVWNEYPKVSVTDVEEASIDETKKGRMKLDLKGNAEQEQLSGKNLWINEIENDETSNGITVTRNEDGSLTFNGTSTDLSVFYFTTMDNTGKYLELEKTYTISGIGNTNNAKYATCIIGNIGNNTANDTRTFTPASTREITKANSYIAFSSGTTLNNYTLKPMIEEGSTATSYEPYCGGIPSPNPDFPQPIKNVIGSNEFKIQNKNLAIKNTGLGSYGGDATSTKIVEYSAREYSLLPIKPNTQYTIWREKTTSTNFRYFFFDKEPVINETVSIGGGYIYDTSASATFTTPSNAKWLFVQWSADGTNYSAGNVQIEIGSTATDFVTHQEQNLPFDLKSKNLFDKDGEVTRYYINNAGQEVIGVDGDTFIKTLITGNIASNYVISYKSRVGSTPYARFSFYNGDTFISRTLLTNNNTSLVVPANTTKIDIRTDILQTKHFEDLQIEEGTTATDYEPYYNYELSKIGDAEDYFSKEAGKWYVNKEIGKVVLDGTESWTKYSPSSAFQYTYYLNISNAKKTMQSSMCSHFRNVNYTWDENIGKIGQYSDNTNGAKYFNTDKATLEEWKDWLAEQYANETPVILVYILATPSKTEITETTLINQLEAIRKAQSNDDQTNITQTNEDLPFILNIEALKK